MSYDSLATDQKRRDAVIQIHETLRSRLGASVTLADVCEKFQQTYGMALSEQDCAKYLSQNLQSKRAGISSTTTAAGVASDEAGRATMDTLERGTDSSHHAAASLHNLAAEAHQKATNYHLAKAEWHTATARGESPEVEVE